MWILCKISHFNDLTDYTEYNLAAMVLLGLQNFSFILKSNALAYALFGGSFNRDLTVYPIRNGHIARIFLGLKLSRIINSFK